MTWPIDILGMSRRGRIEGALIASGALIYYAEFHLAAFFIVGALLGIWMLYIIPGGAEFWGVHPSNRPLPALPEIDI